jgi:phosphoglycerol transferase MdoB-like AlkP superfamily enzyme
MGSATSFKGKLLGHRQGGTLLFCLSFLLVSFATRLALFAKSYPIFNRDWTRLGRVFLWGSWYDLVTVSYWAIPTLLYFAFVSERLFARRWHRALCGLFVYGFIWLQLLGAVSEWLFWDEFETRFNFIAVDYLYYPREIFGNIYQSYPIFPVLGLLSLVAAILYFGVLQLGLTKPWLESRVPRPRRLSRAVILLILPLVFTLTVNNRQVPNFGNRYNQELARNGLYSMGAALHNSQPAYDEVYRTEPSPTTFDRLIPLLASDNSTYIGQSSTDITRLISGPDQDKRWNVIQITLESMSGSFLSSLGGQENLAPNLDRLASQGLLFTNFYAVGTRTVRGLASLTTGRPPCSGRSIIKRPHNEHMETLGGLFRDHGYKTTFLYSGDSSFDNMKRFFGSNGYDIFDSGSVSPEDVTFRNIWGACDEDLYKWVIREADRSFAAGEPFHQLVMTTSNHRPYTYPKGKIDIPSHTTWRGGVKYSDYAIGEFIARASQRPWFANTLIVFVADHCRRSSAKADLGIDNYHIPLLFYNPNLIQPGRVDTLGSQIDFIPTLLGLMGWTYKSQFFGQDLLTIPASKGRAIIANYQNLGYLKGNHLTILKPDRAVETYQISPNTHDMSKTVPDSAQMLDTISYYQSADILFREHQIRRPRRPLPGQEFFNVTTTRGRDLLQRLKSQLLEQPEATGATPSAN